MYKMVNIKNKIESIKDFITHSLVIYPIIFYTFIGIVLNVSTNLWNEYIVYPSVREEYVEIVGKPLEERRQYFKECFKNKKYPSEYLENLEFRISISATEEFTEKEMIYLWNEYVVYPEIKKEHMKIVGKSLEKRTEYFNKLVNSQNYPTKAIQNLTLLFYIKATEKELNEKDAVYFRQKIIKNRQKGIENLTEKEVQNLKERIEYKLSLYQNTYSIKSNNKLYKANLYPKQ